MRGFSINSNSILNIKIRPNLSKQFNVSSEAFLLYEPIRGVRSQISMFPPCDQSGQGSPLRPVTQGLHGDTRYHLLEWEQLGDEAMHCLMSNQAKTQQFYQEGI